MSEPVIIAPGDNWQAKIDANPAGTLFLVLAGDHLDVVARPKLDQRFHGASPESEPNG